MPYTKIFPIAVTALVGTGTAPPPPAIAGPASTFVWRPGGANAPGVYNTWSGLMSAVNQVAGQKFITYDDSFGLCEVIAGSWNVDNCVFSSSLKGGAGLMSIDNGALLVFNRLSFVGARVFIHTTSPVTSFGGSNTGALILDGETTIDCLSTGPLLRVSPGINAPVVIMQNLSDVGDGVHPVFQIDAGADLDIVAVTGSSLATGATSGAGTVSFTIDMSITVFGSQAAGFTVFPLSDAHSVPYTPTTLANWSNNNPRTLQLALDRIAAKISPIP